MKEATSLTPHYIMLAIFFLAGAVCFIASLANAQWFLNSRNIIFLRKYLKPKWIRIAYIIIGLILMISALYFYHNLQNLALKRAGIPL